MNEWMNGNRQNIILNNVAYLCKGIKAEILRGNISEVVRNNKRCKYSCNMRIRSWVDDLKCQKYQFQLNLA